MLVHLYTMQFGLARSNVYHANCIEQLAVVQLLYMYSPGNNDDLLSSWKMQMVIALCLDLYGWDFIIKVLSRARISYPIPKINSYE